MNYIRYFLVISLFSFVFPQGIDPVYTGSFGSVTINNQVYNQFSLRPELAFGKIGLGLDLYFYFDQDGNLYEENWNFSSTKDAYKTLVDKIYYLRWGLPYDDLYFRIGSLPSITLGNGSLVNNYSNVMDYPRVRRTGFNFKYKIQSFKLQFVHSDLKEAKEPGLIALGGTFEYIKNLDLSFNIVADPNQRKGLLDSDGDGYPDFVETGFANNPNQWHNLQDNISDLYNTDFCINAATDSDLNGIDDGCDTIIADYENQILEYSNLLGLDNKEDISGLSLGLTYTVNNNIKLYSEFSQLSGKTKNPYNIESQENLYNNFDDKLGYGFIPFGLKAEWEKVTIKLDYRQNSANYLFNYWDQNYDHNRAMIVENGNESIVVTKEDRLYLYGKSKGASFSLISNFLKVMQLEMTYQHLDGEKWDASLSDYKSDQNSTFYTKLDIDTSKINKVRIAEIFYKQSYASKPFSFNPDENTLFGYNIGVEMADNMVLILKGRKSYVFDNGDYKPVKTTQIETQIIF